MLADNRYSTPAIANGLVSPRLVGGAARKHVKAALTADSLQDMLAQHIGTPRGSHANDGAAMINSMGKLAPISYKNEFHK